MALQHLRSSTADKRPTPAAMSDGQLALNTNLASPGLFFKDSNGDSVKIGPVHVGTTAPNATPGAGGQAGNSKGEAWLDTTAANPILKVFNGSAFVAVQPVGTGTVVSTTDTGTVTSTMILDGTILNADVNASAAIAGTKISPDFGSQTVTTTGVISSALGAAATPSITFTGDLNTGIYSPGADQVAISTNGTGRVFVDSAGNVGVGISPSYKFDVAGALRFRSQAYLYDSAGTSQLIRFTEIGARDARMDAFNGTDFNGTLRYAGANLVFETGTGASVSERLRITSAGLVGVGTSSPSANLTLKTSAGYSFQVENASQPVFQVYNDTTASTGGAQVIVRDVDGNTGILLDGRDNANSYFNTGGKLGIGTTSPLTKFVASNGGAEGIELAPAYSAGNNFTFHINRSGSAYVTNSQVASAHIFRIASDVIEAARIDSSGRLLIGTSSTSSVSLLLVQGNSSSSTGGAVVSLQRGATSPTSGSLLGEIRFGDSSSNNGAYITGEADGAWTSGSSQPTRLTFFTAAAGSSSPTERMRISQNGQFSVFKDSGSSHFTFRCADTASSSAAFVLTQGATNNTNGTNAFIIAFNGNATNTNNSYGAISDIKLKENIVDANSQWDDLKALQVRKYNFKEGQTHTQIGLVAQEVELVSPGLVSESPDRDEDGNDLGTVTKSVNYSVLYMKAVKALQEAMERIETLEARLTAAGIE
jgi:hypothetical protein